MLDVCPNPQGTHVATMDPVVAVKTVIFASRRMTRQYKQIPKWQSCVVLEDAATMDPVVVVKVVEPKIRMSAADQLTTRLISMQNIDVMTPSLEMQTQTI